MNKILLIDGNALLFRIFYAIFNNKKKDKNTNNKLLNNNFNNNTVCTFIKIINKIIKDNKYYSIIITFDKNKKNFRHKIFNKYKYGRKNTPIELILQIPIIKKFLKIYNIKYLEKNNFEADDVIGYLCKQGEQQNYYVDILTNDNDLFQLITNKTRVLIMKKGISNMEIFNQNNFIKKWKIIPKQIPDLKGLMGDVSDNIKGVPGIGKKTAIKLINKFHNIEGILQNIDQLTKKNKQKIVLLKEKILIYKKITTIVCNIFLKKFYFNHYKINNKQFVKFCLKYNINLVNKK